MSVYIIKLLFAMSSNVLHLIKNWLCSFKNKANIRISIEYNKMANNPKIIITNNHFEICFHLKIILNLNVL